MIEFIDLKTQQARIKTEIDAGIARVLAHGQYILGPEVAELEEKLAAYVGAKYCISVANGTDALQIAQMALVDALYSALVARNAEQAQLTEERMVKAILPKSI